MIGIWIGIACHTQQQEGWISSTATQGPMVRYDPTAVPLPEIPLPNDQATRLDPTSPTGRRVNISEEAPTEYERRVRRTFNTLDGFGTFAPIMVSFDAPLDVQDLYNRHSNHDFRDDAVFLLNVDPDCSRFGEEVTIDIQSGKNPITLYNFGANIPDNEAPNGYRIKENGNLFFPFDSRYDAHNILFEERYEDQNNNGILDEGEDIDSDGILDIPNFINPRACLQTEGIAYNQCVADNLMNFYDRQANRLYLKPLWPLEQQCTYAVVLSNRLRGENQEPIQSPFPFVNPQGQTEDLRPAEELLSRYGLDTSDVAFAWTFTTGSMTKDLEELRKGLYGHGAFSQLKEDFPTSTFRPYTRSELAELIGVEPIEEKRDDYHFDGSCVGSALTWLWGPNSLNEWSANMCAIEADLSTLGMVFGGTFQAPNLLADKDGIATDQYPADNDEIWNIDYHNGVADYGHTDVSFWCSLPQETDTSCSEGNPEGLPFCKPFPVILYAHGYGGSRNETMLHMGRHNAMGYAMCGVDSYGHGLNRWKEDPVAGSALTLAGLEFSRDGIPELGGLVVLGRDRDLNNDGLSDPGADMWTSDVFHTRDMVRQSVLEYMQLVRILRSMDGTAKDHNGHLLGDIDQDGTVDIAGPQNTIGMWGISLGGILSGVLAGAEPSIDTISPNAGGAGLVDISIRARQAGVPEAVVMPMLGQLIIGCLPIDDHQHPLSENEQTNNDCLEENSGTWNGGDFQLAFVLNENARKSIRKFAQLPNIQKGDNIIVRNLISGEEVESHVTERGRFRVGISGDALDPVTKRQHVGLRDGDTEPRWSQNNHVLGDSIQIEIFRDDTQIALLDSFGQDVTFQGVTHPQSSPLIVLQEGLGYKRNTPDFARFLAFAQSALSPADPGVWGAHTFLDPLEYEYDPYARGTHVLMMPTAGDQNVPVNTGIAMGRVSGLFGSWIRNPEKYPAEQGWRELFSPDERYGIPIDDQLVQTYVVEGDATLQRFENPINPNVLYDIDNISDGMAQFSCGDSDWSAMNGEHECPDDVEGQEIFFDVPNPNDNQALRHNIQREDESFDAFRIPLLRPGGQHGIYNAQAFRVFDADAYMVNFTIRYLGSRGKEVNHESGCDCTANTIPQLYRGEEERYPALGGEACTDLDINICPEECQIWGFATQEEVVCIP